MTVAQLLGFLQHNRLVGNEDIVRVKIGNATFEVTWTAVHTIKDKNKPNDVIIGFDKNSVK